MGSFLLEGHVYCMDGLKHSKAAVTIRQLEFDSLFLSGSIAARCGSVAEWFKAAVLKTADGQLS
jgi:hypothetical protein